PGAASAPLTAARGGRKLAGRSRPPPPGGRPMSTALSRAPLRLAAALLLAAAGAPAAAQSFSLEQVRSYPFPNELTAAATGSRIAWALNEEGRRNLWVAEGPDFRARKLT